MIFKIIKTSYFALGLAIAAIGLFLFFNVYLTKAEQVKYDLAGWFWTDNYGWISLNSENADLFGLPSVPSYKVIVENNEIYGWGWSSNVGWVCFGKACDPNNICNESAAGTCQPFAFGNATPSGGWRATIDGTSKLNGWAKIVSLKDSGLINLGVGETTAPGQAGVDCYDCKYDTSTPPALTGCHSCFTKTKFDNNNLPDNQVESVAGGSGNICQDCVNCQSHVSADSVNSRVSCGSCSECKLYGGVLDSGTGGLIGWGWSGNQDPQNESIIGNEGAGWVQLNALGGASGIVYPWVQTVYGAVFGSGSIRQKSVVSGMNATYCIFAKDVYNFRSSNCTKSISNIDINFPQKYTNDQSYKNALGRVDLAGLSTRIKGDYNKYGNIIVEQSGNQTWSQSNILGNRIYVVNGDLTIESGFEVNNAAQNNERGNGLIIVNGDLNINADFDYDGAPIDNTDLKKLASVAWVVKGDVVIKPTVKKIVGAFIVLGGNDVCLYEDGSSCSGNVDYPKYKADRYGVFFSGASENPLVVSGLLVAKAFDFRRTFSNISQGSEKIIYDGRLIANPPPGLKSFIESLPVIRDFEF